MFSTTVCHFYSQGYCKFGEYCRYAHPPKATVISRKRSLSDASLDIEITTEKRHVLTLSHIYIVIREATLPMQTAYPRSRVRGRGAANEAPYVAPILHSRDVKGTFSSVGAANARVMELFKSEMGEGFFERGEEKDGRMWWEMKIKEGDMWDDTKLAHKVEVRVEGWALDEESNGGADDKGVTAGQEAEHSELDSSYHDSAIYS